MSELSGPVPEGSVHDLGSGRLAVEVLVWPEDQVNGAGVRYAALELGHELVDLRIAGAGAVQQPQDDLDQPVAFSHATRLS